MIISKINIIFLLLLIVAPAVKFFKISDGIGSATIFTSLFIVIFLFHKIEYKRAYLFFLIIFALTIAHSIFFIDTYQLIPKYLFSLFGFFIFYILSVNLANQFQDTKVEQITKHFFLILLIMFPLMLIDYFFINIDYIKSIFPFTEHSHFYINTFIIFLLLFLKFPSYIFLLYLILLFFNPSLTAVPLLLLMTFLLFKKINKFTILIFLISILVIPYLNYDFYIDRIVNFERNRSSLTYLQGVQFIVETLKYNPFGVGFQQMNCNSPLIENYYTELITSYYSYDTYQCDDAGFSFSKIVFELGYLGLIISLFIAKHSISSILFLIKDFKRLKIHISHYDFFKLLMIPIFIDFFVRGYGYFSFNILLFMIGYIGLKRLSNQG